MQTSQASINPVTAKFEGFFLQTVRPGLENQCQEMIRNILGHDWQVQAIGDNGTEFEITLEDDALSAKQAWEKSYQLRSQPGVIDVEPLFAVPISEPQDLDDLSRPDLAIFDRKIAEESSDVTWGLQQMGVLEAWKKYFPDPNYLPGQGIIIAHPDTGYTLHPEILKNLSLEDGFNYIDRNKHPFDTLERASGEIINNPGHGTSTASLVISPPGPQGNYENGKHVVGVAPGAKLIPLRVTYSVVLLSIRNLAAAIRYATDNGCHVISISLGTAFPNPSLRSAIVYAQKRGVIIVAAAGTMIPYVVYPAAYDEVVAVTTSNVRREIWWGASRGKKVDVTAPGQELWHAKTRKQDDEYTYNIEQDSGTSFSAAIVAGVAALWLSYHGRDKLIERYGAEKIPFIFNQLLRDSCEKFPSWKPNRFGAGIVNVEKLLGAPLPDNIQQAVVPPAFALQQHTAIDRGELDTFQHLFESYLVDDQTGELNPQSQSQLRAYLAELLQTDGEKLGNKLQQVGQELAFYLTTQPDLYQHLIAALQSQVSPSRASLKAVDLPEQTKSESSRNMLLKMNISDILQRQISTNTSK